MSDTQKIEPYYQAQAKQTVDTLFDGRYFHPDITRDGMQAVEDLLAFLFQSQARSAVRCAEMSFKLKPHVERLNKLQPEEQPGEQPYEPKLGLGEVLKAAAEEVGIG